MIYIWVSINDHPYSINSGYLLFLETTIIGKTANLAMVQKMVIDTLHKEGKSQRVITERVAVQGVLYQSILNTKLTGRNWIGKCAQATGMTASLRILSSKADSNTWESFHKEWTEAGVSASRVTTLRHLQEKGYQATSETETSSEASYLG